MVVKRGVKKVKKVTVITRKAVKKIASSAWYTREIKKKLAQAPTLEPRTRILTYALLQYSHDGTTRYNCREAVCNMLAQQLQKDTGQPKPVIIYLYLTNIPPENIAKMCRSMLLMEKKLGYKRHTISCVRKVPGLIPLKRLAGSLAEWQNTDEIAGTWWKLEISAQWAYSIPVMSFYLSAIRYYCNPSKVDTNPEERLMYTILTKNKPSSIWDKDRYKNWLTPNGVNGAAYFENQVRLGKPWQDKLGLKTSDLKA